MHERAGNATFTDADGLVKFTAHNIFPASEELDNALWTKVGINITPNAIAGPMTGAMAELHIPSTGLAHYLATTINTTTILPSSINVTVAGYMKSAGYNGCIEVRRKDSSYCSAAFDLVNGVVLTSSNLVSSSITDVGGGWYLCSIVYNTMTGSTISQPAFHCSNGSSISYTADGTSGTYFWGLHCYRNDMPCGLNYENGTYYVATGAVGRYLPRINHYINGVKEGFLVENVTKANQIWPSESLSSVWFNSGISITGGFTSPSGQATAQKITVTGAGSSTYQTKVITATAVTLSCWVKRGNFDSEATFKFQLYNLTAAAETGSMSFNFSTLDLTTTGSPTMSGVITYPDGWYRIYVSLNIVSGNNYQLFMGRSGTGTINNFHYQWGMQVEYDGLLSSYIPTTTAAVTRAADINVGIAGTDVPLTTPISIQMSGKMSYTDTNNANQLEFYRREFDNYNYISNRLSTLGAITGRVTPRNRIATVAMSSAKAVDQYVPGIDLAFNIATRHTDTTIQGAERGDLLTAGGTVTGVADMAGVPVYFGGGQVTVKKLRVWVADIGSAGITLASTQ